MTQRSKEREREKERGDMGGWGGGAWGGGGVGGGGERCEDSFISLHLHCPRFFQCKMTRVASPRMLALLVIR